MKSLDQVEPRIIINAANTPGDANNLYIITNVGSYYLAANLVGTNGKNGIEILANNVTLDLNGFSFQGVSGFYHGIFVPNAQTNIAVKNGSISGWGYVGLYIQSGMSFNIMIEGLNVSGCYSGIELAGFGMIRNCNCVNNSLDGMGVANSSVYDCSANNNGRFGLYAYPCTVSGCIFKNNTRSGVYVNSYSGTVVMGNTCIGNNTSISTGDAGIIINSFNNRVEGNQIVGNGYAGIYVNGGSGNIVIKNSVSGNGANNYLITGGQIIGPLITAYGTITNSNPWANFSF